jgi:large subunit ribosomal protein L18
MRLSVFRSARYIYAQVIDDRTGRTLAEANSKSLAASGDKTRQAAEVGKAVAERAAKAGVTRVVFDRGPYRYHGRVKALADGAREGGLEF